MPRIPFPTLTDFETYNQNTKGQYEALGRFLVAFETMVNEVRENAVFLLRHEGETAVLANIAFHHPALTAKPLFEIFRAIIIEYLSLPNINASVQVKDTFRGVFKTIATEYFLLVNTRNTLVHGTWQIGYTSDFDPNADNFELYKYQPTSAGLERQDAPKHAFELLALKDRCEDTKSWISHLHGCVPDTPLYRGLITDTFVNKNSAWHLKIIDGGPTETLPRK